MDHYQKMLQNMKHRALAKTRRQEMLESMQGLEDVFAEYRSMIKKVKNFTNDDWRKLIREPARMERLKSALKQDSEQFVRHTNRFRTLRLK